jgi:hypothetical protein
MTSPTQISYASKVRDVGGRGSRVQPGLQTPKVATRGKEYTTEQQEWLGMLDVQYVRFYKGMHQCQPYVDSPYTINRAVERSGGPQL